MTFLTGMLITFTPTITSPGGTLMIDHQAAVIHDACAWPNLTELPDDSIVAIIFNKPAHGSLPGDVDCWQTTDDGKTWSKLATVARRPEPNSNRMNVAAGLAPDDDLVVVASGYRRIGEDASWAERLLPAVAYRSSDGSTNWHKTSQLPTAPDGQHMIPFGDIVPGADGNLRVFCYTAGDAWATYMLTSENGGRTWQWPVKIGDGINECAPLHLGDGHWLAAIRTNSPADLHLFASDDDGANWTDRGSITEPKQHPGHLLRLADDRILLTYGNRRPERPGVEAIISADEGQTWTDPVQLVALPMVDLGYPSSVQLADGRVLSAYYAKKGPGYDGYHMGVVIWHPPGDD